MGHMIEQVLAERGIECAGASEDIAHFDPAIAKEAVCIDFTVPDAFRANYKALASLFKAVVVGTTGWYDIQDEVFACFEEQGTPLIWASNFSVGVNVLKTLAAIVDGNMGGKTEIQAIRAGEIPGIHTVVFEGKADRITLEHEAFSRRGFAEGAVTAALMTEGLCGVHEFKELFLRDL